MPETKETTPRPVLPRDDAQFELFRYAIPAKERVRVEYLAPVPDDPALPEDMRKRGLETIVEGHAISVDDTDLILQLLILESESPSPQAMQTVGTRAIPRDTVLKIEILTLGTPVTQKG